MLREPTAAQSMAHVHDPLRSVISGHLPRLVVGEQELLDLIDMDHIVDTLSPLYQLAPWEIRRTCEELVRRNPHPRQRVGPTEIVLHDRHARHTDPGHHTLRI